MRLLSTIGKGCETMKRGTYIKKQLLAWILMTALLLPVIPGNVTFAFTENTTEDGFVTDITGLDVWENVRLKKSVTITENVTVTGQVKLESGAAIYISSGRFILDSQATIDGDIYIEKSGMAELFLESRSPCMVISSIRLLSLACRSASCIWLARVNLKVPSL